MSKPHPDPSPPNPTETFAERAWRRFTSGLPPWPSGWDELVEEYVADVRPRDPERTAAVLLLALDNAYGWDRLLEGGWIYLAGPHVYVHFDGGGVGLLRTMRIADRFLAWLGRRELVHEWDVACLRHELEAHRTVNGGRPRGIPAAWDVERHTSVERLSAAFLEARPQPLAPDTVEAMIRLLASATRLRGTDVVRFGALDPLDLWELSLEGPDGPAFVRDLARVGAGFYRWLADEGHLEPGRARHLERELVRMAALPPDLASSCRS